MKKAKNDQNSILSRALGGILITILFVLFIMNSVGCQIANPSKNENNVDPDLQQASYEAKIAYYSANLQTLHDKIAELERQIFTTQTDFLQKTTQLEAEISNLKSKNDENSAVSDVGVNDPVDAGNKSDFTYQLIDDTTAIITAYVGNDAHVIVPSVIDGFTVIKLADRSFAGKSVQTVELPATIQTLGWFTFYGCEQLEAVNLPSTVSKIGYASFDGCPATLCLQVVQGSYAEAFAASFGLRYQHQP